MNTRSLKFRLVAWYAGLVTVCFALLGLATYLVLRTSLRNSVAEAQLRRARQIAQIVADEGLSHYPARLKEEVETRYAPALNDRFVRISRRDGLVVYHSSAPKSQSFDPAALPPPDWPNDIEGWRPASLVGGRGMLIASHVLQTADGQGYLIESGAPMDELQADLRKWLLVLLTTLPVVTGLAVGGGFLLVKQALMPVDQAAASAERISSMNLSERLPVARTGDELERLSVALNHMIERLDAAFQYSRRFVADASHELRTPLAALQGELESLTQGSLTDAEWRDRLGSALEEVERLSGIVEGLFAISRLDAGEAAAEWVKFDLGHLASTTADQMALLAEDKRIRLSCNDQSGVWVAGDRARLKQVVVNLLDNAIKYTPEGGAVSLNVQSQKDKALLEVTDTGIGIPPASLPRVFDRFYRVDPARNREMGGAGLGLSIVKSICTAHHGRVEATSEPGHGSRFCVELPLIAAPAGNHTEAE